MEDREKLVEVWREFFEPMSYLRRSTYVYPEGWEIVVDFAEEARRQGHYAASARAFTEDMISRGALYPGYLMGLFKTFAVGDVAVQASVLAALAQDVFKGMRDEEHAESLTRLIRAESDLLRACMQSESDLTEFFRELSGNPDYELSRDFKTIAAEWNKTMVAVGAANAAEKKAEKTSGCYIATAVYGSYDAPQVVVLRRFRDERLATSWLGRAFIRTYYTVSPLLVAILGRCALMRQAVRGILDRVVSRLC